MCKIESSLIVQIDWSNWFKQSLNISKSSKCLHLAYINAILNRLYILVWCVDTSPHKTLVKDDEDGVSIYFTIQPGVSVQDDDEGIDVSGGNGSNHHENEKNRRHGLPKGPYVYELFSIMIHSGSASGGHYYAYIKDFSNGEWFCFNDTSVTRVSEFSGYHFRCDTL